MTEWIDVPVAEVAVGDDVKIDGYGAWVENGRSHDFNGSYWDRVGAVGQEWLILTTPGAVRVRRSSIVAVRRRKPEPSPKPGDWRCVYQATTQYGYPRPQHEIGESHSPLCRVYRASSGNDTRTGQPWVMQEGDPVNVTIPAKAGSIAKPLEAVVREVEGYGSPLRKWDESLADYYKRIGLDVRPVERRKR